MTSDLFFALEATKFASREVYGVVRIEPKEKGLLKLLNKQIIFQTLSDSACLEGLMSTEIDALTGYLILKS
jgi:hypothetical protein